MSERGERTPGPWHVYQGDQRDHIFQPGHTVCKATPAGDFAIAYCHYGASPDGAANARLIAAAPDMYEALKGMCEMYAELVNSGDCGFWDPEEDNEMKAARAAIAKAEGK